jgi:LysM repeat protein
MNKIGMVLGLAAVAAIAGCKDPNWNRGKPSNAARDIVTAPPPHSAVCACPPGTRHSEPCSCGESDCKCEYAEPAAPLQCTCAPGLVHDQPCTCGGVDCKCVVVKKDDKPAPPPESEYTVYIVQRGDYLAKISKKYNITISAIKSLNGLKDDNIRIGQKLKLPGKVEVGEQKVPEGAIAKPPAKSAKTYAPYTGATKEYVVKSGDTLGAIAYGNGINIRQLKELNGLSSDVLRIGQKLKIPAEKVVAPKAAAKAAQAPEKKAAPAQKTDTSVADALSQVDDVKPGDASAATLPADDQVPSADDADTLTYTVQEGEDLADVSIRWGVSAAAVRELNNLGENDKLRGGQVLRLPAYAQQQN